MGLLPLVASPLSSTPLPSDLASRSTGPAFGTLASHLRTAGGALPGKMFCYRRRVERLNP